MGAAFPIIALALSAAGTGAGIAANQQVRRATNNRLNEENIRQRRYQQQATDVFNKGLAEAGPSANEESMQSGAERFRQTFGDITQTPFAEANTGVGALTDQTVKDRVDTDRQREGQVGGAMMGYNQRQLDNAIKRTMSLLDTSRINNFSQGSLGALQTELLDAQHAGDTLGNVGMGLSTAGSLAGLGSLMFAPTASKAELANQIVRVGSRAPVADMAPANLGYLGTLG